MKKIFTLGLGILILASCSSEDKRSSIDEAKLTNKKWYYSKYVVLGQTIPYENEDVSCGKDYNIFLSNGTFEEGYYSNCEVFVDEGAWVLEGKKITVSTNGDVQSATIKKLTDSALEIESKGDYDEDGKEETIKLVFTSN